MAYLSAPATAVAALFLLLSAATVASATKPAKPDTGVSIANPSVCVSDAECAATHYCKTDAARVTRCAPRLSNGAECDSHAECAQNSFCFVDTVKRCRAQGALNDECSPVQGSACRRGLVCTPPSANSCVPAPACSGNVGRCLPARPGRAGASCVNDRDCAQDDGFFCKGQRVCARKKATGAPCDNASDNFECAGYCARGFFSLTGLTQKTNGVCAPTQGLGGRCTEDFHCKRSFTGRADRDRVFCNRPRGANAGRCALSKTVLRRLGARCNPRNDLCDARRGLSCRWAPHLRRAVCQQRFDALDDKVTPFCTVGSKLSACPGPRQLFATECRVRRPIPGNPFPDPGDGFTRCLRRRRVIPAGASCELESDVCARGSTCRVIAGIRLRDLGFRPRFGAQPAVFCVRTLYKGARCGTATKFTAQCAPHLRCVSGTCAVSAGPAPREAETHANVRASCADLPCAPGFTCNKDKLCARPVATTAFGGACEDDGVLAPACRNGVVCRTNWGPSGVKRCLGPRGLGAYCEADKWCKRGLVCPTDDILGAGPGPRRCSKPLTTPLKLGQACKPGDLSSRRCGDTLVAQDFSPAPFRLLCLRRGGPKCQIAVESFSLCGAANVQCADPTFECRGNVCLPRKM